MSAAVGIPAWVDRWVGLPFVERGRGPAEFDCWGLFRAAVLEQWGVDLPSHADAYTTEADRADLARIIEGSLDGWTEIPASEARLGDGVLIRVLGDECHVGLVVAPGWMLHTFRGRDSTVEPLSAVAWRNRVVGYFRHAAIAGAGAARG